MIVSKKIWIFSLVLIFAELSYVVYFLAELEYVGVLPVPFFFDRNDSFMDLFHTMFWSWREGRYSEWRSIYPMFPFAIAQLLSDKKCVMASSSAFLLRDCSLSPMMGLGIAYVIGCYFSAKSFVYSIAREAGSNEKNLLFTVWFLITILSTSGLFALERGNLIVFAFMFLSILACSRNFWVSSIFLSLAISVKQYLILLLMAPFIEKKHGYVILVTITVFIVELFFVMLMAEDHAYLIVDNMLGFSSTANINVLEKIWFPTSIAAWSKIAQAYFGSSPFQVKGLVAICLLAILWSLRLVFVLGFFYIFTGKEETKNNGFMNFFIVLGLLVSTDSVGGYGILLLFPFVGPVLELFKSKTVLILLGIIFIPLEVPFGPYHHYEGLSFLTTTLVTVNSGVSLMSYIRVIALACLLCTLVAFVYKNSRNNSECIFRG